MKRTQKADAGTNVALMAEKYAKKYD